MSGNNVFLSKSYLNKLPKHIAIIMDGNGRWAKKRHLPRIAGHREGLKAVQRIIKACVEQNIEILTLFAFGTENWHRPEQEVDGLMSLFLSALKNEIDKLQKNNIQLRFIGERARFNQELKENIKTAEKQTEKNTKLKLIIAADYSGRWDIVQAVKQVAKQIERRQLTADEITADLFANFLQLADLPAPDLLIRTSGEKRISNFLLWQLAYTEFYFTDILWPDFNETTLIDALIFYANRERRFGQISEQLNEAGTI